MEAVTPRPHDLLRLPTGAAASLPVDAPEWAQAALRTAPWVVVRRAVMPDGFVAVGIRGSERSHRYAWSVASHAICDIVTPEALRKAAGVRDIPAMRAFTAVRAALAASDVEWGPTGSVGFELATAIPTATADSDLDLVVRLPANLTVLHQHLTGLDARVDCQVDTPAGAIALAELVSDSNDVLVKTPSGARLMARAVALT